MWQSFVSGGEKRIACEDREGKNSCHWFVCVFLHTFAGNCCNGESVTENVLLGVNSLTLEITKWEK